MAGRLRLEIGCAVAAVAACAASTPAQAQSLSDLRDMSIEQLADLDVSSVSKRSQSLAEAPASIYVIDHDQIVRSGAVTIPEILRLAPNLQVYQSSPAHWVVTARGLSGDPVAQSFSNKLLVLVDGRTVYTPLFSGVYWDMPDMLPEDIERIEVISGPGATLWGANAVNGVINIITRSSSSTPGAMLDVQGGTVEQAAGLTVGGRAGDDLSYRLYGRAIRQDSAFTAGGGRAGDGWHRLGGGFRVDWAPSTTATLTVQGDLFDGKEDQGPSSHEDISGRDLVARWTTRNGPDRQFQVQAFYDRIARATYPDGGKFHIDTWDVDLQHSFPIGKSNEFVWGGGARVAHYLINGSSTLFFVPAGRDLFLANAFIQDTFSMSDTVSVTAGLKAERDPYVGVSLLPDVRLSVTPSDSTLLWAAVSHAVRSPTPFDEDVQERVPGVMLTGNPDFRTEKLTAYELGLRAQPLAGLSFSVTGFYHHYDDLRTVELGTGPGLDLYWGNGLAGHSYGVEAWGSVKPLDWWTLSAGATVMRENFHFKTTAPEVLPTSQNGLDPGHWLTLRSSMDLGPAVSFDVDFRAVGRLHGSDVPAYAELGGRLAWAVSPRLSLTLSGENLLHSRHVEYAGGDAISRKVLVGLQVRP